MGLKTALEVAEERIAAGDFTILYSDDRLRMGRYDLGHLNEWVRLLHAMRDP